METLREVMEEMKLIRNAKLYGIVREDWWCKMPNLQERIRQAASDATVSGGDTTLRDEFEQFKVSTTEALKNVVDDVQSLRQELESKRGN